MTGTITRLVDSRQAGSIGAEDGNDYAFAASSLRGVPFSQLSLGTAVIFVPRPASNGFRADAVQLVR